MSFLRRALGGGDKAPDWAAFMKADEYRAFADAVLADFTKRGLNAQVTDDGAVVVADGAVPGTFGLSNLAQLCHALERSQWTDAIRSHFENLEASERAQDDLADFTKARDLLKVRVFRTSEIPPEALEAMTRTALAPDLVAVLAADLPTTVMTVNREMAAGWGVPIDELFAIARQHMAAEVESYERSSVPIGDGVAVEALVGDSFFVASQIIRFEELAAPGANGALVALANRHQLLWHDIEKVAGTVAAVQVMLQLALRGYQEGPGSLTPDLYWWHRGALTLLPGFIDKKGLNFVPPDEFVQLLNGLG